MPSMAKFVSITISALVLIQSFGFHANDLVVLDELITHAKFHAEAYGDNFFVFLSKHYGELKSEHSQKHQEEQKDHEKLPFQQHSQFNNLPSVITADFENYDAREQQPIAEEDDNFFYINSYHSLTLGAPFQPPRLA
tara:strand:- start:71 stop:481 length:411 start_codon:yes stop_codon:yes gene_type:complete